MDYALGSVWNWDSLNYSYFLIPDRSLDAGGFGPAKGIALKQKATNDNVSVSLDSLLPPLPTNAMFVGVGEDAIGELYRSDGSSRQSVDINELPLTPNTQKLKDILLSTGMRANNETEKQTEKEYLVERESVWEAMSPYVVGLSIGLGIYKFTQRDLRVRDVLLAWGAGVGLGLGIGSEIRKAKKIRGG
jgi:hypothetical protein